MFGKRLAALRKQQGISQYKLAEDLGLSRGQLANYETRSREPDFETLLKIAKYFDVTTDYLLGFSNMQKEIRSVPILDSIGSDIPVLANMPAGYFDISNNINADFVIIVRDNSMLASGILPGDYAICREAHSAQSEQIVVTCLRNGLSKASLKYLIQKDNEFALMPERINYFQENKSEEYRIVGVVIAVYRNDIHKSVGEIEEWADIINLSSEVGLKAYQVKEILLGQVDIAKRLKDG